MMPIINAITVTYAVMLFVGGLIGYFKAHSTASLTTGIISSLIVIVAWQLCTNKPKAGYLFIAAISLVLCTFFLNRFTKTFKFMPGGLMLVLSTITLVGSTLGYLEVKKELPPIDENRPEEENKPEENKIEEKSKA